MKIRLHGPASEMEPYSAVLRRTFDVLDESGLYTDRAPSRLCRRYLETQMPAPDPQAETIARVLAEVSAERFRQLDRWGVQHRVNGTGGPVMRNTAEDMRNACNYLADHGGADWRAVLLEEVYEAMAEDDQAALRAELVQVAAVCAAWVEDIDSRGASSDEAVGP
ncbi:hypothetical protein KGQ20_39825 [Catenulispora sp. NF23]|uniref:hypothetical protein n=1 Tax=Catenulispora pinistramenti TaxID=2705254 RepID=UPI001BA57844|nr:hypothetical protein [Catenulispora pinistramenti]MBS2538914.1 hypothetical protein [Catenulispora pinistramenti]